MGTEFAWKGQNGRNKALTTHSRLAARLKKD